MNVQGRIVLCVLAGIAAGLLTWIVSDVSGLMRFPDKVRTPTPAEWRSYQIIGMVFGGLVGVLLGVAERLSAGSMAQTWRAARIGLMVGAVSGLVGLMLGASLFGRMYIVNASNPLSFLWNVLARALGWAFIGALTGTADGWRKWSVRVGRNGFIGGFIGGLIGGTTFEIVPYLMPGVPRPGVVSRLFGFVITGACIGLFVALVQQLLKEAWIRVVVGRNEGREYLIEKAETRIGRSELSDIAIYGDTSIERRHAVVAARPDGRYVLTDASQTGTSVNGERIKDETVLRDGDRIQIGGHTLIFHERLTKKRTQSAPRDVAAARRPGAVSPLPSLGDSLPPVNAANGAGTGPRAGTSSSLPPGARLVAVAGPHVGKTFPLGFTAVIGRDEDNDIALPGDKKTSRRHARLLREGANYVIEDTGSTNGTFVNGQKVKRQALMAGDTVLVGNTALRFE